MTGAIIIVIALVIAIPVGFLMSTSVVAGALGELLRTDAERRHADSELLEHNT